MSRDEEQVGLVEMGIPVDVAKAPMAVAYPQQYPQLMTSQVVVNVSTEDNNLLPAGVASCCFGEFGLCCMLCCCNTRLGRLGACSGFAVAKLILLFFAIALLSYVSSLPTFAITDRQACLSNNGFWLSDGEGCACPIVFYVLEGNECVPVSNQWILSAAYHGIGLAVAVACAFYYYKRRHVQATVVVQQHQTAQPAYPHIPQQPVFV
ncbi:hypothetical protein DIPPA_06293 [Diplonema papillatum]|nr:hypothetical protein DIPPA_14742 [Diplonema papillatum]KAJ9463601.1 hypothetical protein DIPPA_06293 [Diplonema papillatum]